MLADPARLLPLIAAERHRVEADWLEAPPAPAEAFARADEVTSRWIDAIRAADGPDRRPRRTRRYWDLRDTRAGMPRGDRVAG